MHSRPFRFLWRLVLIAGFALAMSIASAPQTAVAAVTRQSGLAAHQHAISALSLQPWAQIEVSLRGDSIQVRGFTADSPVTASIYDSEGGNLLWSGTQNTDGGGYTPFWGVSTDIVPGYYVLVTDDASGEVKSLTVADLKIEVLDDVNDIVSGHAPADTWLSVSASSPDGQSWQGLGVTSNSSGQWSADFGSDGWNLEQTTSVITWVFDGDNDSTQYHLPVPRIGAALEHNWIDLNEFQEYAQVEFTLFDSLGGTLYGPTLVSTNQHGHAFIDQQQIGVDLTPGMVVTATDIASGRSKTHELADLYWNAIDYTANTASGTAPPDSTLRVEVGATNFYTNFDITANGSGQWSIDYAAYSIDIDPSMWLNVMLDEADWDRTMVQPPPFPTLQIGTRWDWINFNGFTPDGQVEVEIEDGGNVLYSATVTMQGDGHLFHDIEFDLAADQLVTATDLTTGFTKEHIIHQLSYDALDYDADTASGTAAAGSVLWINIGGPGWGSGFEVTADASGQWNFDFGAQGIDATIGNWGGIEYYDEDRDATFVDPPPVPQIEEDLTNNYLNAHNLTPSGQVEIEILDGSGGSTLVGPFTRTADSGGHLNIDMRTFSFTLAAGQLVRLTDLTNSIAKEHYVVAITFDDIDYDANTGSGSAPPNADVQLNIGYPNFYTNFHVTADSNGYWTADFGANGLDIQPEWWISAAVWDSDQDRTYAQAPRLPQYNARITANLSFNWVSISGFTPFGLVDYAILDANSNTLWSYDGAPIDSHGNGTAGHPVDLIPGMTVRATDVSTGTVRELLLQAIDFDTYDVGTDIAAGTAEPNATVTLNISASMNSGFQVTTDADASGNWSINLAQQGHDLDGYHWASAEIREPDGDATNAEAPWILVQPETNFININHFTPNTQVEVSVYASADDPQNGTPPLLNEIITVNNTGNGWLSASDFEIDIVPGNFVVAHDNANGYEKSLIVQDVVYVSIDTDTDIAVGTAPAGALVSVQAGTQFSHWGIPALTDASGNWTASFAANNYDVQPNMYGNVWLNDNSMDVSEDTITPPPTAQMSVQNDIIGGYNFTPNGDVLVEVYDSDPSAQGSSASKALGKSAMIAQSQTAVLLFSGIYRAQGNTALFVGPWEHGLDLLPGMFIVLTDLTTDQSTNLEAVALTFDDIDYDNNIASGTAEPGAYVTINAGDQFYSYQIVAVADENGVWTADFGALGVDITFDMWINVNIRDEIGGENQASPPPFPQFWVAPSTDVIGGWGWSANAEVQIEVFDSEGGALIAGPFTAMTNEWTDFWFNLGDVGFDLQDGMYVRITNSTNGRSKATTAVPLTYDYVDYENDVMGGTALPGTRVTVSWSGDGFYQSWDAFADANGVWTLDLAAFGFNASTDMLTNAQVFDQDRDSTQAWDEPDTIEVSIDIRPGSPTNIVNCRSESLLLPVAVLSDEGFDATQVDPTTVGFGPNLALPLSHRVRDVNHDGLNDLVLTFRYGDTGLDCDSRSAELVGQITDGPSIMGSDGLWSPAGNMVTCSNEWAAEASFELAPGDWSAGMHSYDYLIDNGGDVVEIHQEFEVSTSAPLKSGQVFLRVGGLSALDGFISAINPAQDTVIQVTFLTGTTDRAEAVAGLSQITIKVRRDGGAWITLNLSPVRRYTAICNNNPGFFWRAWGGVEIN